MPETTPHKDSARPLSPDGQAFTSWFWHRCAEAHPDQECDLSREAALRMFSLLSTNPSEDQVRQQIREDRDGARSLSAAIISKAHLSGLDFVSLGVVPPGPSLNWTGRIFVTSGAEFFFQQAIQEYLW